MACVAVTIKLSKVFCGLLLTFFVQTSPKIVRRVVRTLLASSLSRSLSRMKFAMIPSEVVIFFNQRKNSLVVSSSGSVFPLYASMRMRSYFSALSTA